MSDELFRQGVSAAKAGDLPTARKWFVEVLRQDPQHVNAWLALGYCQTDLEQKKYCLTKVLSLDPNHEIANRLLQELNQQSSTTPEQSLPPDDTKVDPPKKSMPSSRSRRPIAVIAVAAMGCILGVVLVGGLLYLLGPGTSPFIDQIAQAIFPGYDAQTTIAPANTLPPSWTKTPTSCPTVYISPSTTPTLGLAQLLSVSHPDITKALDYMENENYAQAKYWSSPGFAVKTAT